MKIGLLIATAMSEDQDERFGRLSDMYRNLLLPHDPLLRFAVYDVHENTFPQSPLDCDAWLISGSAHSAYDPLPWIERLEALVRDIMTAERPLIGICFGHQLMAQAMGGRVARAPSGLWGIAVHRYQLAFGQAGRPAWMSGDNSCIDLQASHQDQVLDLPPGARCIAGNAFCPNGMLVYGRNGLSLQLHPELSSAFIADLIERRAGDTMSHDQALEAGPRVTIPVDDALVGQWMVDFFRQHKA